MLVRLLIAVESESITEGVCSGKSNACTMIVMLDRVRIVLVNPTHPGNVGAAARAMKNMGLSSLYLVQPQLFPHKDAIVRAAGADDILRDAVIASQLSEAIADCHLVFATSARTRSLTWPICTPRECAEQVRHSVSQKIAIVFGRESRGLSNEELVQSHYHIRIPTNPLFSSLNLAAAVQVLTYELFITANQPHPIDEHNQDKQANIPQLRGVSDLTRVIDDPATVSEVTGFLQHLEYMLVKLKFLDPNHPKLLLQRLYRMFQRARLEQKEINILRGILAAIEKQIS